MLAETLVERELNADVPYLMRKLAHHDIDARKQALNALVALGPIITGEFYVTLEKYPTQPSNELFAFTGEVKDLRRLVRLANFWVLIANASQSATS